TQPDVESTSTLVDERRVDVDARRQRLMDGASLRDREQARALLRLERARQLDLSLDALDAALSTLAFRTVLRVLARVAEPNAHALERPALPARAEVDRHQGAAAERPQKEA